MFTLQQRQRLCRDLLRGLLRLVLQRPLSHGLAKSTQRWQVLTGLEKTGTTNSNGDMWPWLST